MNDAAPSSTLVSIGDIDRRQYLGSGDIAGIMGLSPWQTPLQVYEKKIGGPEEITPEKRKFFDRRKRQEPVIAEMLADEYGIEVTRLSYVDPNRYRDAEHPFIAAEIDYEFLMSEAVRRCFPTRAADFGAIPDGTLLNGSIKTAHPFTAHKWGDAESEDVPIEYAAQDIFGCGVTRRPAVLVAALFGLDNLVCYPLMADQDSVAGMREKAVAFWNNHVLPRIPPDPINMEDMMRLFSRVNGRPIEVDPATQAELEKLKSIRSHIAALETEKEEVEFAVADYVRRQWGFPEAVDAELMDNALLRVSGSTIATWKKQSRGSIDSKRLRAEHPELAEAFTRTTWFRTIRFPKGA